MKQLIFLQVQEYRQQLGVLQRNMEVMEAQAAEHEEQLDQQEDTQHQVSVWVCEMWVCAWVNECVWVGPNKRRCDQCGVVWCMCFVIFLIWMCVFLKVEKKLQGHIRALQEVK